LAAVVLLAFAVGVVVSALIGGLVGVGVGMAAMSVVLGGASAALEWLDQPDGEQEPHK
jgi:hypothetical protein